MESIHHKVITWKIIGGIDKFLVVTTRGKTKLKYYCRTLSEVSDEESKNKQQFVENQQIFVFTFNKYKSLISVLQCDLPAGFFRLRKFTFNRFS